MKKARTFPWKILVTLLCLACSSPDPSAEPTNVFGEDNREDLDVSSFPGQALGRLEGGCSGAIIGKNLAITAAHCVYDTKEDKLKSNVNWLHAGYKDGNSVAKSWIQSVWLGTKRPETDRKSDWAVLSLEDAIGNQVGWFGVDTLEGDDELPWSVSLAGYAADRSAGEEPFKVNSCYIHKVDEKKRLLHDCDAATGTSGGPLYIDNHPNGVSGASIYALSVAEFRVGSRSMNRRRYSHQFANIGVSASDFVNVVEVLRSTVDHRSGAPEIEGTHRLVNLNSNDHRRRPNDDDNRDDDQDHQDHSDDDPDDKPPRNDDDFDDSDDGSDDGDKDDEPVKNREPKADGPVTAKAPTFDDLLQAITLAGGSILLALDATVLNLIDALIYARKCELVTFEDKLERLLREAETTASTSLRMLNKDGDAEALVEQFVGSYKRLAVYEDRLNAHFHEALRDRSTAYHDLEKSIRNIRGLKIQLDRFLGLD